ncbi:UPF0058 family protein [Halomicrococcus sp. NG-SE-24]|uniref:UPF0058 family protein n=1 Tax=Halomicrococcus sp. NG-SE-24 TaxID=3436928 RepID=UPI003D963EB7
MKKQELIHLHGLLAEIHEEYETQHREPLDISSYKSTGVKPTSIHRSKTAHKEALFALAEDLTDAMEDQQQVAVHAD